MIKLPLSAYHFSHPVQVNSLSCLSGVESVSQSVKFVRASSETGFDVFFRLNQNLAVRAERPFDFRCFFIKPVIGREHCTRVVLRVEPITDAPKQVRPHVREFVLSRDVCQVTPAVRLCAL